MIQSQIVLHRFEGVMRRAGWAAHRRRPLAGPTRSVRAGAEIKTRRAKKKKTDREDARLLLKLLLEDRFPRIWVPSPEDRDLRQLL